MNSVYIVDDDPLNIEQFLNRRNIFIECGFDIVGAQTNPIKALEEIQKLRPDVVCSDLKMPILSGIELLEKLHENENPPIFVMISAYNEFNDVRKFFKKHGFDYLIKPVTNYTLIELLNGIAEKMNKLSPVMEVKTPSHELNKILMFLREYPAMNHTLEVTGARYGLSPKIICGLFSRHLNTTFIAYLTNIRMEKAEELLHSTDLLVKEIAVQCGYSDYFYFTRVFAKTHDGMTPTEFREEMRGES